MESFFWISIKIIWNTRNESYHCFFVAVYKLNEAKIILVYSLLNPDPLMLLKLLLLMNLAALHDFSHLIDWYH